MITVKPIEWSDYAHDDYLTSSAKTLFGRYEVWRVDNKSPCILDVPHQFDEEKAFYQSMEEGKAAALAHYEKAVQSLLVDPNQELVSELRGAADEEDKACQQEFYHAELLRRAADALDPATPRALLGWKRKYKGSSRGGAYIHTHPDVERAIVENHNGISFDGHNYPSVEAAKEAALNSKTRKITGWQWQFEANGPWHTGTSAPEGVYHSEPVVESA